MRLNLLKRRRGNAIIEFMFMLPFYCSALFGALEFGTAFYERLQLTNSSREGVRRAAVGKTLADIRDAVRSTSPQLNITDANIAIEYNTAIDDTGSWVAAADSGSSNSIPVSHMCRVRIINWRHTMVTGTFFSWVPGVTSSGLGMSAQDVMVRE